MGIARREEIEGEVAEAQGSAVEEHAEFPEADTNGVSKRVAVLSRLNLRV